MADYFDPKATAYTNIENIQEKLRTGVVDYLNYQQEVKKMYASVFAQRMTVNSVRKKADSLKKTVDQNAYQLNYQMLMASPSFAAFIAEKGSKEMNRLICTGHGGEAEDEFKKYVLNEPSLAEDLPSRYMPSAKTRIDTLQKELDDYTPRSNDALRVYSQIFRSRRSVGAVHGGNTARLDSVASGPVYGKTPDLEHDPAFREFVRKKGEDLYPVIKKGHGGEAEHMFRDFVTEMDHIPPGTPQIYMGTALKRTEGLKKKIGSRDFKNYSSDKKLELFSELMASRASIGAVRGKSSSLERTPDVKNLNNWANYYKSNQTFRDFIKKDPDKAIKSATTGHGGALEDDFKDYIKNLDHIPADIAAHMMPIAKERTEILQKKIDSPDFQAKSKEKQTEIYAELMASREAVGAVRKKEDTLKRFIHPQNLHKTFKKWNGCKTFGEFLHTNQKEAKAAALSGHGGALSDKFRDYVKNLDHIPADVPAEYVPTAKERTEILQDKIKKTEDPVRREKLYMELMATRMAVGSVRKNVDSLNRVPHPSLINKAYESLEKSSSVKSFLQGTNAKELKDAATAGHGGALEDKLKEAVLNTAVQDSMLPENVPDRYKPEPGKLADGIKKDLSGSMKSKNQEWFRENKQSLMKKTAALMYLSHADAENQKPGAKKVPLSHEKMKKGVDDLVQSQKFNNMVNSQGVEKTARSAVNDMGGLIRSFAAAPGQVPGREPQPQPGLQNPQLQQPQLQQPQLQQPQIQPAVQNPQLRQPGV